MLGVLTGFGGNGGFVIGETGWSFFGEFDDPSSVTLLRDLRVGFGGIGGALFGDESCGCSSCCGVGGYIAMFRFGFLRITGGVWCLTMMSSA